MGTYPIQIGLNTLAAPNYTFSRNTQAGALTIKPAPLSATASSFTIKRGDPIPPLTYTLSGFVNSDTAATAVTGTPNLATSATSTSPAGVYPISITLGSLKARNYSIVKTSGTLTITP